MQKSNQTKAPLHLYPQFADEYEGVMSAKQDNMLLLPPRESGNGVPPPSMPLRLALGPESHNTTCPHCMAGIKTTVRYTTTTRTHIAAALCSLMCCCCCLPYCMDSAKNTDHYCPNCLKFIGTYEK